MMLTWSMKKPRISSTASMPIWIVTGARLACSTMATRPAVAPEKLKSWAKVVAPTMMKSSEPEIDTVPISDLVRFFQLRQR